MRRFIITYIIALSIVVGIGSIISYSPPKEPPPKPKVGIDTLTFDRLQDDLNYHKIIIIDSCEYISGWQGYYGGPILTHKGNCSNPVHKR